MPGLVKNIFRDGGPNAFIANVDKLILVNTFTNTDTFNDVNATNNVAEVAIAGGDVTLSGAEGAPRVMTVAAKPGVAATADSGASPDHKFVFVDTVNQEIYWVPEEDSDLAFSNGDSLNFPSLIFTINA